MSQMDEALEQAGRYLTQPHVQVVRPGDGDHDGPEDNPRAAALLGKRAHDIPDGVSGILPIDQPVELGFHCPVCVYENVVDGDFDERLTWSEYRAMLWCHVCERDYPSTLCLPDEAIRATETFLDSIEQAVRRQAADEQPLRAALARIERWCHGIARKATVQGNDDLAATLPRIGEEIARALADQPLEYANDPDPTTLDLVAFLDVDCETRLHGLGAPDGDAPLDRAARWAHELAEVARALDDAPSTGRYSEPEPGMPLHDRVYDVMAEQREIGERDAAASITPEVLFRVVYPVVRDDEETGARRRHAAALRDRLAAELGWST